MSNNKNSNRKILTVLLLLIFVGAGIFYFTMNLDESEFAEPMNEEELELLEDESEDEPNDEPEGELDEEPEDTTSLDVDDLDTETTRTDDETDDQTDDPDNSTSLIDDQDIQDSPADSPDLDDDRTAVDDGEDPEHDPEIAEEPAVTEDEDDGIIDRIISFLSEPFREEDPEDIAIDDIDDIEEIEDINDIDDLEEITKEDLEQTDSPVQLASKNLVVLGIDDLSDQQELSFDFIGLISFNAEDLEIEFKIIPSRYTYEDQEIRTLSRQELTAIITELTGLEIDYELVLDYSGFQYYVDEIGGIELELADDFMIPDLELELTQGNNYLDGSEALNYARFYNPDNGERSRINRQQEVIDKIYHKSLRLENILRLPGHYNHLINEKEAVDTDIDQELIRNTIRYIRQLDQLSIKYSIFND